MNYHYNDLEDLYEMMFEQTHVPAKVAPYKDASNPQNIYMDKPADISAAPETPTSEVQTPEQQKATRVNEIANKIIKKIKKVRTRLNSKGAPEYSFATSLLELAEELKTMFPVPKENDEKFDPSEEPFDDGKPSGVSDAHFDQYYS